MIRLGTALTLALLLAACDAPAPAPKATASAAPVVVNKGQSPFAVRSAIKAIKAETGVIDMVYDDTAVFQWVIGMKSDGSLRYGRAESFCILLSQTGIDLTRQAVRIVDFRRYMVDGDGRAASMGAVDCEKGRHIYP